MPGEATRTTPADGVRAGDSLDVWLRPFEVLLERRPGTVMNFRLPVRPDARQFGNTQKAGCSWVVCKTRLPRRWSRALLRLAVLGIAPLGVEMSINAWVVRCWWRESARPVADGYCTDALSQPLPTPSTVRLIPRST